jgi:hypothetical protein
MRQIGPFSFEDLDSKFIDSLGRLSRAQNLLALAKILTNERFQRGLGLDVDLQLYLFPDEKEGVGQIASRDGLATKLTAEDWIAFKITNRGNRAVDVTLLEIDDDYRIIPKLPDPEGKRAPRLRPGESITTAREPVEKVSKG